MTLKNKYKVEKYVFSIGLLLSISFYLIQKNFIDSSGVIVLKNKNISHHLSALKKEAKVSKNLLIKRGTAYKWSKPIQANIYILNQKLVEEGRELSLEASFKSELDLKEVKINWSLGSYTKVLKGSLVRTSINVIKNQTYSYSLKLLDFSKGNQRVYFSVLSKESNLHQSVSINTDQSLKIMQKQKLQEKLTEVQKGSDVKKTGSLFKQKDKQPMY